MIDLDGTEEGGLRTMRACLCNLALESRVTLLKYKGKIQLTLFISRSELVI